jgi:Polyketide cyclase / dehydrase and lipid transport
MNGGKVRPPFRSKQEVVINSPLEAVWAFNMDLRKIAEFHPRVWKVDLISGKDSREAGVAYRCHLTGGKHTCIEKDIEIVPMERIVTILPEDSFGISKVLNDYTVETSLQRLGDLATRVRISHFYSTKTFKAWLLNLIARRKIARDTQAMLNAMKAAVEGGTRCAL